MTKQTSSKTTKTQVISGKTVKIATEKDAKVSAKKVSEKYAKTIEILKNR